MSTAGLLKLTYVSTAAALSDAALKELVVTSQDRNARNRICGFLLYNGTNFLQTIEGETDAVERLMATIAADTRHAGVRIIDRDDDAVPCFTGNPLEFVESYDWDRHAARFAHVPPRLAAIYRSILGTLRS